jgi:hypothetical protein
MMMMMMLMIDNSDDTFLKYVVFFDEATFCICGKVNRPMCQIWGSENPHEVMEHELGTPGLRLWHVLTFDFLVGPFIFEDGTATGASYLNMLKNYSITRMP